MEKKKSLREILSSTDSVVVLDGGLATELERKGCNINSALWSAEVLINQPQLIEEVHLDYFMAGATVAITASYQGSVDGLMKHQSGMTGLEATALIRRSVELARSAASNAISQGIDQSLFVAGSVGPYGAYLADGSEYRGDYNLPNGEMKDFHRPRIQALVEAGVDILAFETIPSCNEAKALLELLQEFPSTGAWFSFTLKDKDHISDGTSLEAVVELLNQSEEVLAIGINCIAEDLAEPALAVLHKLTAKPLVVYPNSGEVYDATTKTWSGKQDTGESLHNKAQRWRELGARLVGGCCRTTPESIATIAIASR